MFSELGDPQEWIYLIECRFHDKYDGIIGNDILRKYRAIMDYDLNVLKINNLNIPLRFPTTHTVKLITNVECGLTHIKDCHLANGELILEEGVYNTQNFKVEIETNLKCPDIIHVKPQDSWSVTRENYCLIDNEISTDNHSELPLLDQIRIDHLNSEERRKFSRLVNNYFPLFYQINSNLTFTNAIKHHINTTDNIPIYSKTYRYPYVHKEEVKRQIQDMLENGIIRPSNSPYSAPIWIVPKKDDASGQRKWRLVVDYRKLNEKTVDDRYPIPNIDEILDKLGRSMYFTTLDLAKGFHQVEIAESDIHKTAFSVEGGHYEFLRMPFGLKTAPATFQRLMNNILGDLLNKVCLVYLDDIIIFSTSLDEHINSLRLVMDRLKEANLKIQIDKCEFLKRETEFLGHVVTQNGIRPNPKKIECVLKYPIPQTPKQIKQFLGLSGYYRKFMRDYSKIAKPMTSYLKKDSKIDVNNLEYKKSFETLKTLLVNDPILAYPDFSKSFILNTDASNFALGAVLSQENHPICYASRTLNVHELNYSTIEKELLAIVWAVKYFRPYLFGRKFTIHTDHQPLQWLFSIKEPNSRLVRWRLKLEEYDYTIKYKKGANNGNADALSRIEPQISLIEQSSPNVITTKSSPINMYKNQIIIRRVNSGSLKIRNQKIFNCNRKTLTAKNFDESTMLIIVKTHFDPKIINAVFIKDDDIYTIFEQTVLKYFGQSRTFKIIRCNNILTDITDENELAELIHKEHIRNNHRGINENFQQLKHSIYHPRLKNRITQFINNCDICNREKYERNPIKQKLQITETPNKPGQIVHIDVFYSLEKTLFLTFIDKFTKFAQAIKIENRTWIEFRKALMQYLSIVGSIKRIVTDNELGFKAIPLTEFLREREIEIHFTSNNNHSSNSDVERLHNTINEHIRILRHDPDKDIDTVEEKLYKIIMFYNNTIHSSTGCRPSDFMNGKIKEDSYPSIEEKLVKTKEKIIEKANQNREDCDLHTGDVYIKQERGGKNHPKFRKAYVEKLDDNHVTTKNGHKYYKSHLKRKKTFQ